MQETLKQLETEAIAKVEAASSLKEVNDIRVQYLGKKDRLQKYFAEWASSPQKKDRKWVHSQTK